jgi:hypothetical protein
MPTQETADPTASDADRRVERAKASLLARVELLKHKLSDVKETFDVRAQIAKHALPAVGIAFALGAAAGLRRSRSAPDHEPTSHPLRSAAFAAVSAFGLRAVREVALAKLGDIVKQWWTEHGGEPQEDVMSPHDTDARGQQPFAEPFAER